MGKQGGAGTANFSNSNHSKFKEGSNPKFKRPIARREGLSI
jgi:hypothetical protein